MKEADEQNGVWRTVGGRRIFIQKGENLTDAMKRSGKFKRGEKSGERLNSKREYGPEVKKKIISENQEKVKSLLNEIGLSKVQWKEEGSNSNCLVKGNERVGSEDYAFTYSLDFKVTDQGEIRGFLDKNGYSNIQLKPSYYLDGKVTNDRGTDNQLTLRDSSKPHGSDFIRESSGLEEKSGFYNRANRLEHSITQRIKKELTEKNLLKRREK